MVPRGGPPKFHYSTMFRAQTSTPLISLIKTHEDHPGDTPFDINFVETKILDRILYKRITVSKNRLFFSGKNTKSRKKEVDFVDIRRIKRSRHEKDVVTLITMDGKKTSFRFKGEQESRVFFDLVGYHLTIDPSMMM